MSQGFTFTVTPEEANQLGLDSYPQGHECKFLLGAVVTDNQNGTLTFQATELEKIGDPAPAEPNDMVGASPMYKAGMGYQKPKPEVKYVKLAVQPHVS